MKGISAAMVTGMLLALTFLAIALSILLFPASVPAVARHDLQLYALLTGAYGIWRLIRVWMLWREAQENG